MHYFLRAILVAMAMASACWSAETGVAVAADTAPIAASIPASPTASVRLPLVAVMPFTARSMDTEALEGIASALGSSLLNTGKFRVLERSQMEIILREQGFQQSGACDGSECAVEMGKLLSVDQMVIGTVAKIGNTYSLTARLVGVGTGEVSRSVTRNSRAEVDALVTDAIPLVARELAGEQVDNAAVPPKEEHRSYLGWWLAGGAVVVGGVAAAIVVASGSSSGGSSGSTSTTHTATVSW